MKLRIMAAACFLALAVGVPVSALWAEERISFQLKNGRAAETVEIPVPKGFVRSGLDMPPQVLVLSTNDSDLTRCFNEDPEGDCSYERDIEVLVITFIGPKKSAGGSVIDAARSSYGAANPGMKFFGSSPDIALIDYGLRKYDNFQYQLLYGSVFIENWQVEVRWTMNMSKVPSNLVRERKKRLEMFMAEIKALAAQANPK